MQPNPVWYHMQIDDPGDVVPEMNSMPEEDIDFICWGPFDDPYEPCLDDLNGDKIEDCIYLQSSKETCNITDAEEGEYYILMITNFSNQECNINFSQTGGDGATDCGILPGQISSNSPVCEGDTLFLSANTVSGADYNWTGPNGFTSSQQDIVIPDASQDNAGEYELIIEVDDEVTDPVYYDVVVYETPQISAGVDQSIPFGTLTDLAGQTEGNPLDYTILWEPEAFLQENRSFKVSGHIEGMSNFRMQIFNRWGQLLFSTTDQDEGWDGTFQNTPVQSGTYTYLIRFVITDDEQNERNISRTGTVTVVK